MSGLEWHEAEAVTEKTTRDRAPALPVGARVRVIGNSVCKGMAGRVVAPDANTATGGWVPVMLDGGLRRQWFLRTELTVEDERGAVESVGLAAESDE